ncbi:hypothetical protein LJC60_07455 [Ruminococcaceae bacterium OttesenSCG-928-D13]|nr:hypothetical protein [Ruminococcaceae bacterium OttesenSCG-928-D13]
MRISAELEDLATRERPPDGSIPLFNTIEKPTSEEGQVYAVALHGDVRLAAYIPAAQNHEFCATLRFKAHDEFLVMMDKENYKLALMPVGVPMENRPFYLHHDGDEAIVRLFFEGHCHDLETTTETVRNLMAAVDEMAGLCVDHGFRV